MEEARLGRGTYTDDTEMMIALCESLLAIKGFDGADLAEKFLINYNPQRGYGAGTTQALFLLRNGVSWDKVGDKIFYGGSYGNGSAMRVAPIGLCYSNNMEEVKKYASLSSVITHSHPIAQEGATLQASAVALAYLGEPQKKLDSSSFLDELSKTINQKSLFQEKINIIKKLLKTNPFPQDVINELGHDSRAHFSVPTAIFSFLSHPETFQSALTKAISLGGDVDTIGAMTGAIAGAFHGLKKIPNEWLDVLENEEKGRDYLINIGKKLFAVFKKD